MLGSHLYYVVFYNELISVFQPYLAWFIYSLRWSRVLFECRFISAQVILGLLLCRDVPKPKIFRTVMLLLQGPTVMPALCYTCMKVIFILKLFLMNIMFYNKLYSDICYFVVHVYIDDCKWYNINIFSIPVLLILSLTNTSLNDSTTLFNTVTLVFIQGLCHSRIVMCAQ